MIPGAKTGSGHLADTRRRYFPSAPADRCWSVVGSGGEGVSPRMRRNKSAALRPRPPRGARPAGAWRVTNTGAKTTRGSDGLWRGSSRWECSQWRLSLRPISAFYLYMPVFFFMRVGVFFFSPAGASLWFSFFVLMTVTVQQTETEPSRICVKASNKKKTTTPISSFIVFSGLLNNMRFKTPMVLPQKYLITDH